MRRIDAFPVFAEIEGGGLAFREASGRIVVPRRTPTKVVISRADYDLHPLAAPSASSGERRLSVLEDARALFPEGVDGLDIEVSPTLDGRRVILLMRRETLDVYRDAAPGARFVLLHDLLRASLPDLGDDIVLHRGARHVELMRFQAGALVDSLLVACRSGGSDGSGAAGAVDAAGAIDGTEPSGPAGGDVMARAVALLASEGWLAGAESRLHLLAPSAEIAPLARRLAALLAARLTAARPAPRDERAAPVPAGAGGGGSPAARSGESGSPSATDGLVLAPDPPAPLGFSRRVFGAIATESLRMRPQCGDWFRSRGALGRLASSPVALLVLLALSAAALAGLFHRAASLEREAMHLRRENEVELAAAGPEATVETEIARLERERTRLRAARPADLYELLSDLRSALGATALLRELTLAQGVVDLRLAGPDPIETLRRLQAAGCLREASLIEAVPSGAATGTEFHVRGRYP